jgi:hypothetical protein
MKKIVMLSAVVFAFVMTANMAFAWGDWGCGTCPTTDPCPCPTTTINQSNSGSINSTTKAKSVTGMNYASSMMGMSSIMTNSATASAVSNNQLGWNEARVSGVTTGSLNVNQTNSGALTEMTKAKSITGMNTATVGCGGAMVNAGATNAGASSMNMFGYNLTIK